VRAEASNALWCIASQISCAYLNQSRPYIAQLVEERFPVSGHPSSWARNGLTFRMRMGRKQIHTLDHPLFLVIEEPIFTRLKAGNDRMARRSRMF